MRRHAGRAEGLETMSANKTVAQPVAVASIPATKSKVKTLLPSHEVALNQAREALNKRYAYVRQMAKVVRLPTPDYPEIDLYAPDVFTSSLERERVGTTWVARSWIDWIGHRNEVYKLAYEPGQDQITPEGNLNIWLPSPCKPRKGDITLFLDYLDRVFKNDPTFRDWFLAWLAYPLQYPGTKLNTAVLFWSNQTATGKSMLGRIMREIYGYKNTTVIKEADLYGDFNHWAEGRQFIMIEEVRGANAEKYADALKALITQQTVFVNKKQKGQYEIRDCTNYYFNSNHAEALYLAEEDRRFFVHNIGTEKYPEGKWENEFEPWLMSGGAEAIYHYLLNIDLTKPVLRNKPFSPSSDAPQTAARREMIQNSKSDAQQWVDDLIEWPANALPEDCKLCLATMKELWKFFYAEHPRTSTKQRNFATAVRQRIKAVYSDNKLILPSGQKDKLYPLQPPNGEEGKEGKEGKNWHNGLSATQILTLYTLDRGLEVGKS